MVKLDVFSLLVHMHIYLAWSRAYFDDLFLSVREVFVNKESAGKWVTDK